MLSAKQETCPMRTVTIPLDKPLTGHGGEVFRRVVVREPTFNEYLEYGDPFMVAQAPQSGIPFLLEDKPAIAAYVRLLVTEPDDPLLLDQRGRQNGQDLRRRRREDHRLAAAGKRVDSMGRAFDSMGSQIDRASRQLDAFHNKIKSIDTVGKKIDRALAPAAAAIAAYEASH